MRIIKKFNTGHEIVQSEIFNKYNIWDTWIISDTHFNHYPKLWDWPARNDGWEQRIINQWNIRIKPEDTVLHLGDFAFGDRDKVFLSRANLNGYIFLIKGNHDKHGGAWYDDINIKLIKKSFFVNLSDGVVVFSHRPLKDSKGYNLSECLNIHGHIHEKGWYIKENYENISVEQTDFAPVKFRDLISSWRLHSWRNEV